jgi:hypothetical protein
MKTSIVISGSGISSKNTLLIKCGTMDSELKKMNFNNYELKFNTKKEAVKSLSKAYQTLSSDKEDWENSMGMYSRGSSLSYDAGIAKIVQTD